MKPTSVRRPSVAPEPVDEITPLVVFLLSAESSFITGAEIPVGGGLTAHGGVKSLSDALK